MNPETPQIEQGDASQTVHGFIAEAAEKESAVTITKTDGKVYTGVPVPTGEPLTYKLATGKRGRPPVVHVDDVASVALA